MAAKKKDRDGSPSSSSKIFADDFSALPELKSSSLFASLSEREKTPPEAFDATFITEEKEFVFSSDFDLLSSKVEASPLREIEREERTKKKLLLLENFATPPRTGFQNMKQFRSPQLVEPDESLDLETGTFSRRKKSLLKNETPPRKENSFFVKPAGRMEDQQKNSLLAHAAPYDVSFKTGGGRVISYSNTSLENARRSLDFLEPASSLPKKPKIQQPRENEILFVLSLYKKIKKEIFPITRTRSDAYLLFQTFKWAWMSLLPEISEIKKEGRDSMNEQIEGMVLARSKDNWKNNFPSVLRKISEKDEGPGVYMKLMVVGEGKDTIAVTDGVCEAFVRLDELLQEVSGRIGVGTVLEVIGAHGLSESEVAIEDAYSRRSPVLELKYNGTKPCLSGPLGYQKYSSFIRPLSSVRTQGGIVGCLSLVLKNIVKIKYLLDLNGSKNIINEEELEGTMEKIEKTIKGMNLDKDSEQEVYRTIRVKRFIMYDVVSNYTKKEVGARLTIWNPPENFPLLNKPYLFFFLKASPYSSLSGTLSLTTKEYSVIREMPWNIF